MNKRPAMILAGGLAAALLAGAAAISTGLGTGGVASATPRGLQPVVRTSYRTVTVHTPSNSGPAPVRTIVIGSPTSSSGASISGSEGDDAFEAGEDQFENDGLEADGGGSGSSSGGSASGGGGGDD